VTTARLVLTASCAVALSVTLGAQWTAYPAAKLPRAADGRVDLTAPTPRTADGKPDLSGIWNYAGVLGFRGGPPPPPPGTPPQATFWNIEAGIKEGLPFTPYGAELRRQRMANDSKDNPDAACLPIGYTQSHTHSQPRKLIQLPGLIVILYEALHSYRQIFMDGRQLPKDPNPTWMGYSIGRWEGDTLVVQSSGFVENNWLDNGGHMGTESLRLTERFRRRDFGHIDLAITIDDPKAYVKPWTVNLEFTLTPDTDLIEYVCSENEKDIQHLVGK